jgi:toxin ParE1/3/4
MQVKWLRKAALNLEDAHDHLAKENSQGGPGVCIRGVSLGSLVVDQPAMGRRGAFLVHESFVCNPIRSSFHTE